MAQSKRRRNDDPVRVCQAPGCPGRPALRESRFCWQCHTDQRYLLRQQSEPMHPAEEMILYPHRNRGEGQ